MGGSVAKDSAFLAAVCAAANLWSLQYVCASASHTRALRGWSLDADSSCDSACTRSLLFRATRPVRKASSNGLAKRSKINHSIGWRETDALPPSLRLSAFDRLQNRRRNSNWMWRSVPAPVPVTMPKLASWRLLSNLPESVNCDVLARLNASALNSTLNLSVMRKSLKTEKSSCRAGPAVLLCRPRLPPVNGAGAVTAVISNQ